MMNKEFTIRLATLEDEDKVSALLKASYSVLMGPAYDKAMFSLALPVMARANPRLLKTTSYYVAEAADGLLAGCGGWTHARPGTGEVEPQLAHIRHFGTHPAWTGKGVGRALFDTCVKAAEAAGVRQFECYASLNAEGFYRALGFKEIRRTDIPMGPDVSLPSIVMRCAI